MPSPAPASVATLFQRLADPATTPAERCQVCRFVLAPPIPDEMAGQVAQIFLCRRFPPTMVMLAVPADVPRGMILRKGEAAPMTFSNQSVLPQVTADAWCGEFKPEQKS